MLTPLPKSLLPLISPWYGQFFIIAQFFPNGWEFRLWADSAAPQPSSRSLRCFPVAYLSGFPSAEICPSTWTERCGHLRSKGRRRSGSQSFFVPHSDPLCNPEDSASSSLTSSPFLTPLPRGSLRGDARNLIFNCFFSLSSSFV